MRRIKNSVAEHSLAQHLSGRESVAGNDGDTVSVFQEFSDAILTSDELSRIKIVPRENLLGTWFRQGDLGFVFGMRGVGKTWLAMLMARRLAEGRQCGPWPCTKPRQVLYADGEMPLDATKERDWALLEASGEVFYLHHEHFFQRTGQSLCFSDPLAQQAILELCQQKQIEVIFLDNLSCLFSGVRENEADYWEWVLTWLLQLRRNRIAVVIVHHANRTGQNMRGTSRREDAAFWVIKLAEPQGGLSNRSGASFVAIFDKNRQGTVEETGPFEWQFTKGTDGKTTTTAKPVSQRGLFRQLVEDGLTSCGDIASEMGVSKATVSRIATQAKNEGWLQMKGREYSLQ